MGFSAKDDDRSTARFEDESDQDEERRKEQEAPEPVRFKDLAVGATFEFDHSGLTITSCTSLAHGPWQKRTARTYVYADQRSVQHFRVGRTWTTVRPTGGCGGYRRLS